MFSAQSLLAGNGASVTCLRESLEPITTLNVATNVTPLVARNFWLSGVNNVCFMTVLFSVTSNARTNVTTRIDIWKPFVLKSCMGYLTKMFRVSLGCF